MSHSQNEMKLDLVSFLETDHKKLLRPNEVSKILGISTETVYDRKYRAKNIIEKQWDHFNDLFTSRTAMKKIMSSLNTLRGPIAHCCTLAPDEVTHLELTIKDWFRPKKANY